MTASDEENQEEYVDVNPEQLEQDEYVAVEPSQLEVRGRGRGRGWRVLDL